MEVHDRYIPDDVFTEFLRELPQVCVEIVLETECGVLLGKRTAKPQVWFWPGGRVYKGETLDEAAHRIAREELGIAVELHEQLGVQSHFWDAAETEEGVSRHTVNVVYLATLRASEFEIELDDQHSDYRYVTEVEPDLHEYVVRYLTTYELVS